MQIKRQYIVDESNRKVAVQLDIETFEKIEETLENYGLIRLMEAEEPDDEVFNLEQAQSYYRTLEVEKPAADRVELPTDYEQAQQQALDFLDHPPLMLNGRYWSRD